jgi:hypothetical protein
MKKILSVLLITVFSLSLFGCAEIEYIFTENYDESLTQEYNIYLDKEYLESHDYTADQMKRFLFEFFMLYWGLPYTPEDTNSTAVIFFNDGKEDIKYVFQYNRTERLVSFRLEFVNAQAYYDFYGINDDEPEDQDYEIKKGFFYYRIIQKVESPFLVVKEKWEELYNREPYDYPEETIDFAQVFMLGLKDESGKLVFKGFKEVFAKIPEKDAERLLYRFALSYARGKMESTADKTELIDNNTYLIWEFDDDNIDREITIITLKPNRVGWYILSLGLTAVFAGILVLVAFWRKKKAPPTEPVAAPPPPNVPPTIFGDDYK